MKGLIILFKFYVGVFITVLVSLLILGKLIG
jgi:hypothetical protein